MKKSGPDRKYTQEFRLSAVKQVIDGGRSTPQVARSLEMSPGTLGNWVARTRKGEALMKRPPGKPLTELEAELARLKQENARLRIEKEILKKSGVLRQEVDVRYAWIVEHREVYSTQIMCDFQGYMRRSC